MNWGLSDTSFYGLSGQVRMLDADGVLWTLAEGQDCPTSIAVDDSGIYWTNSALLGDTSAVMKLVRPPR